MPRIATAPPLAALLAGLLLAAAPAAAESGPSFDCAKAASKVERQICDDWMLSSYDRSLAELYKGLRAELDSKGQETLKAEQRAWLKQERNACETAKATAETDAEGARAACLYTAYEGRLLVLAQQLELVLDGSNPGEGWSSSYSYDDGFSSGGLTVLRMPTGFAFQILTVSGPSAHICDIAGTDLEEGPDLLLWQDPDAGQCRVTFARVDGGVAVSSTACQDLCGAHGYFDATYKAQ